MLAYTASKFLGDCSNYVIADNSLGGIIIKTAEQWIVKRNALDNWCFVVARKNVPMHMWVEWFRLKGMVHKTTPVEWLGTKGSLICFFQFAHDLVKFTPLFVSQLTQTAFVRTQCTESSTKVGMIVANADAPVFCYQDLILRALHELANVTFFIHAPMIADDSTTAVTLQPKENRNKLTDVNSTKIKMFMKYIIFKNIFISVNYTKFNLVTPRRAAFGLLRCGVLGVNSCARPHSTELRFRGFAAPNRSPPSTKHKVKHPHKVGVLLW